MTRRLIMNSHYLQKAFPEIYEDFFTKNNLIISSPQVINRGNITHLDQIKRKLTQKLPTKMYLGINIRKDEEIHLKSYIEFKQSHQRFENKDMEVSKGAGQFHLMEDGIRKTLSAFGVKQGVDLMVVSENEMGTGIAIATIQALLLSWMIHILSGKLTIEQLNRYDDLLKDKICLDIFSTATNLLEYVTNIDKKDINQNIMFTAMISHGQLGQTFGNAEFLKHRYPKLFMIGDNVCNDHHYPKLTEILDFSIISFGSNFSEFYNREAYDDMQKQYNAVNEYYETPNINTNIFNDYINFLYAKVNDAGKNMITNPTNDHLVNSFLEQVNRLGSQQVFIEDYMNLYREIIATFRRNKIYENEELGLLPISSGKPGGTFLCITKAQASRKTIQKIMDDLQTHGYPTAVCSFMSREDGICYDYPQIEQYLDKEIISPYIQENDAILECGECNGKKIIGKHRELLTQSEDHIMFDSIDGKIYINNEVMSHKEIVSQSGTVEIIRILFEHMGEYVNNSQLPSSSYSKSKNEMVGKIIGPLQELMKKRFKEKLDLECTGNIVDFDLKLKPNKIKMYLIKKIFN